MPNAQVLESKKAVVETLSAKIKEATSVVFVDYKGINVAQDTALRQQFREAGVEYHHFVRIHLERSLGSNYYSNHHYSYCFRNMEV